MVILGFYFKHNLSVFFIMAPIRSDLLKRFFFSAFPTLKITTHTHSERFLFFMFMFYWFWSYHPNEAMAGWPVFMRFVNYWAKQSDRLQCWNSSIFFIDSWFLLCIFIKFWKNAKHVKMLIKDNFYSQS